MFENKWAWIYAILLIILILVGSAFEDYSRDQVKIAAIQACYAAGHQDCDKIWK